MTRAGFCVVTKDGRRFSANHLQSFYRMSDGLPMVGFISSGSFIQVEVAQVQGIEFYAGLSYCSECDQSTYGIGMPANPAGLGRIAPEDVTEAMLNHINRTAKPQAERTIPRRAYVQHWTPAEKAIKDAMAAVERAGAHVLLTDAVVLLDQAFQKVADHTDGT